MRIIFFKSAKFLLKNQIHRFFSNELGNSRGTGNSIDFNNNSPLSLKSKSSTSKIDLYILTDRRVLLSTYFLFSTPLILASDIYFNAQHRGTPSFLLSLLFYGFIFKCFKNMFRPVSNIIRQIKISSCLSYIEYQTMVNPTIREIPLTSLKIDTESNKQLSSIIQGMTVIYIDKEPFFIFSGSMFKYRSADIILFYKLIRGQLIKEHQEGAKDVQDESKLEFKD